MSAAGIGIAVLAVLLTGMGGFGVVWVIRERPFVWYEDGIPLFGFALVAVFGVFVFCCAPWASAL